MVRLRNYIKISYVLSEDSQAVVEATDSLAFNIDRGNVNALVSPDLEKAFDTR